MLSPPLYAAARKTDKNCWALFSDTHIAANRAQNDRHTNMAANLTAVTNDLLSLPELPAGVFVTGDCAWNRGEAGDYVTLTRLLEPVLHAAVPVHLLLGNHDQREHFWSVLGNSPRRPLAGRQTALRKTGRVNWFMLDSLNQTLATPGLLGAAQLNWLTKALDANPRMPAVILVHHNLDTRETTIGLEDTDELLQVIRPRPQVKACVFGHTHHWSVTQDASGIHLVNLPPTAYIFSAGEPSGWVRANVETDGMKLELRCVDQTRKDHGQVVKLAWRSA